MKQKERLELWTTNNPTLHKRLYKKHLEGTGGIRCSYCKCNRGENSKQKDYGGWEDGRKPLRYPSWKLVSKNKKQWMAKPLEINKKQARPWRDVWVEIKF